MTSDFKIIEDALKDMADNGWCKVWKADKALQSLARLQQPDGDPVLPCDFKIGHAVFRAGTPIRLAQAKAQKHYDDAHDAITQSSGYSSNKWQPISSAPMDQTDILAIAKIDEKWTRPHIIYFEPNEQIGWLCARTHHSVTHKPTHWMPLPEPPEDR